MKKRILLVEDNPVTIDVVRQELEFLDYEVMVAKNGHDAIAMASSESPALIVMDIALPKLDGLQATARIRSNPQTRDIPVLAATAGALPGDRERCLAGGCDDYLAKPFTHRELGERIERLLKSR